MGIEGKVVAVTGASSGIGEAIALLLAERGARLVLGARRADRLDDLAVRIGPDAVAVTTDVRSRDDVSTLVATAVKRFGRLDVLVSNAGIGLVGPLDDLRVDDWNDMIDVNLRGVLNGIAAALPVFREQGSGHFVTIVSTAGLRIVPNQVVYAATKNAVRTVLEGLRQEAGPDLRVTGISPGYIGTGFGTWTGDPALSGQIADTAARIAIPPDSIARAVAFAIEQPATVDVGDIVVRPTAQS